MPDAKLAYGRTAKKKKMTCVTNSEHGGWSRLIPTARSLHEASYRDINSGHAYEVHRANSLFEKKP
jgi:hypothetical protein